MFSGEVWPNRADRGRQSRQLCQEFPGRHDRNAGFHNRDEVFCVFRNHHRRAHRNSNGCNMMIVYSAPGYVCGLDLRKKGEAAPGRERSYLEPGEDLFLEQRVSSNRGATILFGQSRSYGVEFV